MIVPRHYEDLSVLHENTLPTRTYYVPGSPRSGHDPLDRESSDRFQLLNGEWDFRYYGSVHELTDAFYATGHGRRVSPRSRCRAAGSTRATTGTSTRTCATRSRWTRPTFPRTTRRAPT